MTERIERWQWLILALWLLFALIVIGFLLRGPIRPGTGPTPAPPAATGYVPAPAPIPEFRLGEARTITIKGRVLLPDGGPAGKLQLVTSRVTYYGNTTASASTDADGYYTAEVHVGAYFMAVPNRQEILGAASATWPLGKVATIVTDPPTPGQYDIQLCDTGGATVRGKLTYPDGTPAPGRDVSFNVYGFDRGTVTTHRFAGGRGSSGTSFNVNIGRTTNAQGEYSIVLHPGEYDITASDLYDGERSKPVTLRNMDVGHVLDFTIPKPTKFRFVLPDGTRVNDPEFDGVTLFPDGCDMSVNRRKRPDGDFDIMLSPHGTMMIVKTQDGKYGTIRYFRGVETAGDTTVTLSPPVTGKMRLLSKETGKPIAGYQFQLTLSMQGEKSGRCTCESIPLETDQNGLAVVDTLLVGGDYKAGLPHSRSGFSTTMEGLLIRPVVGGETLDLGDIRIDGDFSEYEPEENGGDSEAETLSE